MVLADLPTFVRENYEIHEWKHASAVLRKDFPGEWGDITSILSAFRLYRTDIMTPGGSKSPVAGLIDQSFEERGWTEKGFDTQVVVDGIASPNPTHKIDCYKNKIAVELEWNNKDTFYDRDLNNFRILFELRAISVGVIITKADGLGGLIKSLGSDMWKKYGTSTTWMSKLLPRIQGGGGGGCPILVFGITDKLYKPESRPAIEIARAAAAAKKRDHDDD
jgi:hypothetical protein